MTIHWHCLDCPAAGETTGTESGADVKHVRAEQHATTTTTLPDEERAMFMSQLGLGEAS